jgi:hypothetical protein
VKCSVLVICSIQSVANKGVIISPNPMVQAMYRTIDVDDSMHEPLSEAQVVALSVMDNVIVHDYVDHSGRFTALGMLLGIHHEAADAISEQLAPILQRITGMTVCSS